MGFSFTSNIKKIMAIDFMSDLTKELESLGFEYDSSSDEWRLEVEQCLLVAEFLERDPFGVCQYLLLASQMEYCIPIKRGNIQELKAVIDLLL